MRSKHQSLLAILILLSGCAARTQPLDLAALRETRTVLVLPAGHPTSLESIDLSWGLLGLPGAAIAAGGTVPTAAGAPAAAAAEFTAELARALGASGWTVRLSSEPPARSEPTELLTTYKAVPGSDGAVVFDSVIFDAGYIAGTFRAYRPILRVWTRLVEPSSGKTLYAQRFIYGINPLAGPERFVGEADDRYYFSTSAELAADPDRAVAGLRAGLQRIASAIADDLKRP